MTRVAAPRAGLALLRLFRRPSPQRDLMRQLYDALGDVPGAVCLAYVEAERDGRVRRPRGAEDLPPGAYAMTLWREAKHRGWFRP